MILTSLDDTIVFHLTSFRYGVFLPCTVEGENTVEFQNDFTANLLTIFSAP